MRGKVFKHPLIIVGVVVAVGGWLFLTSGVAGGSIGSRDIINLHAISLAENVILLGYMTALAGLIAGGFDAVIQGKTHLTDIAVQKSDTRVSHDHDPQRLQREIDEKRNKLREELTAR